MSSKRSLRADTAVNMVSNIVLAVLGVASGSVISYRFGADGRGVVGIAQVITALSAGLGSLGLGDAFLHFIAAGRLHHRDRVLTGAATAAALAAALAAGTSAIVSSVSEAAEGIHGFVLFCTIVAAATAFFIVPGGALRGCGRFAHWNGARIAGASAWLAALAVVSIGSSSPRLPLLAAAYAAPLVLIGLLQVSWVHIDAGAGAPADGSPAGVDWRTLLVFGLPSSLAALPLLLNSRVDQVALGVTASSHTVGLYAAAAGYCWATVPLGQAIATLAATRVAGERTAADRVAVLTRLAGLGSTVILVSGAAAFAVAPLALRILNGSGFGAATGPARLLIVGSTLQGMTFLLEEGARGLGHPRIPMAAELVGLVTMIAGLVAVARYGTIPTAIASVAGYVASFAYIAHRMSRLTGHPVVHLLRPRVRGGSALRSPSHP